MLRNCSSTLKGGKNKWEEKTRKTRKIKNSRKIKENNMLKYNLPDDQIKMIAAATYGENRGQGDDAIMHTASSVFNRLGRNEWQHLSVPEVLQHGYYAVSNPSKNTGFSEAMSGKFKDKDGENEYKRIYAKVAAINRGAIEPTDAQFYFNQAEINRQVKSKSFDFSKVEEGKSFSAGKQKFRTFHYK